MAVSYKIIGANPIKMEVDGRQSSASICWRMRTIDEGDCNAAFFDETFCQEITLTPLTCEDTKDKVVTGSIDVGNELTVNYEITQKHFDCGGEIECACACSPVKSWTVPYYLDNDAPDTTEIEFYYEYYLTRKNEEKSYVCGREKKIGHQTLTKDVVDRGETITVESDCDTPCQFKAQYGEKNVGCESEVGTKLVVAFKVSPTTVPGTGGTVTITCIFKIVTVDENCNETTKGGSFSFEYDVPECSVTPSECGCNNLTLGSSDCGCNNLTLGTDDCGCENLTLGTDDCGCENLTLTESNNSRTLSRAAVSRVASSVDCCYEHDVNIPISVDFIKTNAGVTDPDVDVYYNNEKVTDEVEVTVRQNPLHTSDCDTSCEDRSEYCVDINSVEVSYETMYGKGDWGYGSSVPSVGGRAKIQWDYTAYTWTSTCQYREIPMHYEDIMLIGPCEEFDHPTSYDFLFKEQHTPCDCPSAVEKGVIFNLVHIEICQDQCGQCDCGCGNLMLGDDDCGCDNLTLE